MKQLICHIINALYISEFNFKVSISKYHFLLNRFAALEKGLLFEVSRNVCFLELHQHGTKLFDMSVTIFIFGQCLGLLTQVNHSLTKII